VHPVTGACFCVCVGLHLTSLAAENVKRIAADDQVQKLICAVMDASTDPLLRQEDEKALDLMYTPQGGP
jgi:hypothetical protein